MENPTEQSLQKMVEAHYDNQSLMKLEGEIHFDDKLSQAEVKMASKALRHLKGEDYQFPSLVYLPCAGTLRHVPPLKGQGVKRIVAVDLSNGSLRAGEERYAQWLEGVEIYNEDIRNTHIFVPKEGFPLALLLGNSLGDVTDLTGHMEFIRALANSLGKEGILVFDYVGDRYNPPPGETITTEWNDVYITPEGERIPVIDRRTRRLEIIDEGIGVLNFTCEVVTPEGKPIVPYHTYQKLAICDRILKEQFAEAGLHLIPLGPVEKWSNYHRRRIAERNDLGMMGKSNHLYIAIKTQ